MNEVIKAIKERRSVRKYKPEMLPDELIDRIIEAGLYAASGRGKQAPIIIAVTNKELRDKLAATNCKIGGWQEGFDPFFGAPVVLIVLADKSAHTYVYDGALTMGNMMLAAHSLGIGSCWVHRAKEEFEMPEYKALLKELGFDGEYEGIGHCVLGYPDTAAGEAVELRPFWTRRQTTKFNGCSYITQRGAEAIYTPEGQAQVKATIDFYLENAKLVKDALVKLGYNVTGGDDSPYLWVDVKGDSWEFFDKLLNEANVVTTPGAGFGKDGQGYIRISAFNSRANVEEAITRLAKVLA